mgnify:CR=1 FL=1|tara:strand:+ start:67157 stop:67897 length:741 start_codon:yes stop_codon:yes gene_type:complete
MKLKKILSCLFLIVLTSSCVRPDMTSDISVGKILPRKSFVKVITTYRATSCVEPKSEKDAGNQCDYHFLNTTSSGAVVKARKDGSFILTTGHSCSSKNIQYAPNPEAIIDVELFVFDIRGGKHIAKIIKIDEVKDMCMLHVPSLVWTPVKISYVEPKKGDKIYNLSAPQGVFQKDTVVILEGRYTGYFWGYSMYTVPAIGGSSGSPLFNKSGKLIGMIHSVHRRFHHLSFSPKHKELIDFIKSNTK